MSILNKLFPIRGYLSKVEDKYNIINNRGEYNGYSLGFFSPMITTSMDMYGGNREQLFIISTQLKGDTFLESCVIGKKSWLNGLYSNSRAYLPREKAYSISKEDMFVGELRALTDSFNNAFYLRIIELFYDRLEPICTKGILTPPFFFLYDKELSFVKTVGLRINEEEINNAISLIVDLAKYIDEES